MLHVCKLCLHTATSTSACHGKSLQRVTRGTYITVTVVPDQSVCYD